jgi:hypothetical protein
MRTPCWNKHIVWHDDELKFSNLWSLFRPFQQPGRHYISWARILLYIITKCTWTPCLKTLTAFSLRHVGILNRPSRVWFQLVSKLEPGCQAASNSPLVSHNSNLFSRWKHHTFHCTNLFKRWKHHTFFGLAQCHTMPFSVPGTSMIINPCMACSAPIHDLGAALHKNNQRRLRRTSTQSRQYHVVLIYICIYIYIYVSCIHVHLVIWVPCNIAFNIIQHHKTALSTSLNRGISQIIPL